MNQGDKSGGWEISINVLLFDGLCMEEIVFLAVCRIWSPVGRRPSGNMLY